MDRRILAAMRMMEGRMDEGLSIEAIASELGLSTHHFHRMFVSQVGEPPASFLRRVRMDEAALRLKWADETTGSIAAALGFQSRPAFIRAFQRRFGVTPSRYRRAHRTGEAAAASVEGQAVDLREVDSFHLLAKRYVGDIFRIREYWEDFCNCLPAELRGSGRLHVGLLYDDFRVTEPDKVRYDCGVAVNASIEAADDVARSNGLQVMSTQMGRYAIIRHRGRYDTVAATYDRLCLGWLVPRGHVPATTPAIEVHTIPRHLQDPEDLDFTVLMGVE